MDAAGEATAGASSVVGHGGVIVRDVGARYWEWRTTSVGCYVPWIRQTVTLN